MKMKTKKTNRGSVLVLAVIMVVVLFVTGLAIIKLGMNSRLQSIRSQLVIEAKTAADAGLSYVIGVMNLNPGAYAWSHTAPPDMTDFLIPGTSAASGIPATFTSKVRYNSGYIWDVNSTGIVGQTQRTVYAKLTIVDAFSEGALIARYNCNLANMVKINSYNSSGDPNYDGVPVKIGSASSRKIPDKTGKLDYPVTIGNNGTINADIVVGVGGSTDLIDCGSYLPPDRKYALTQEIVFPGLDIPDYTAPNLAIQRSSITFDANVLSSGPGIFHSGKYTNIDILSGTMTVKGAVTLLLTGNLTVESGSIIITPGSSLTLYINGNITSKEGADFNVQGTPPNAAQLRINGINPVEGGQYFDIWPKNEFYGAIYAPNADVQIWPKGTVHGACICNSFNKNNLNNNKFDFAYDKALSAIYPGDPVFFKVVRWWE